MGINHGCLNILMSEKTLHFSDIDAVLKQMRGETMSERMNRGMLMYSCLSYSSFDSLLDRVVADMVPSYPATPWIDR